MKFFNRFQNIVTITIVVLAICSSIILFSTQNTSAIRPTQQKQKKFTPEKKSRHEAQSKFDVERLLQEASDAQQTPWYLFLLAFLAGILVSFTPCIYPMIPITVGILQAQARKSFLFNIFSSLSYVMGIAIVYASLGYLSATTSMIFGQWLANPFFIIFIILFFLYLAFAMFGFYELYIPLFLTRSGGQISGKKSVVSAFIFGIMSGTVASPCLSPALALLLGIVAKLENPFIGFFTLFCFSLGIGVLLVIVGTFSATLTLLPRAGGWMDYMKRIFGFLMLAACIYFLQPLIESFVTMAGYTLVCSAASLHYFYLFKKHASKFSLALGILSLLGAIALGSMALKMLL